MPRSNRANRCTAANRADTRWISWIAPSNGVVRFETEHSAFDTLLSAYYFPTTNDTTLEQLMVAAVADDSEGFEHESEIKFGVLAGHSYEIAVDGYRGATGPIVLEWSFYPTVAPPPIILASPTNQTVNFGDTVTLTVVLTNEANGSYRWYRDSDVLDVFVPILVIPQFQATDVGRYKLRVILDGPDYYSVPAEIQINTEGATESFAQDKVFDSIESALTPAAVGGGQPGGSISAAAVTGGVLRGYNGSQLFNTTFALSEPDEPLPCGLNTGGSYWFAYRPPTNGTVTLDTIGSQFNTVLAVYTYNPPLASYAGLIPIACDNDAVAPGGASRLEFASVKGRHYAVVVAGVGSAKGAARLSYRMDATRPPVPPTLVLPATPQTAAAGAALTLQQKIVGSEPMFFVWRKNGNVIPGATNAALHINPVSAAHAGNYTITASNFVGAPLEVSTTLRVLVAPIINLQRSADVVTLALPTVSGQLYKIEKCGSLPGTWQTVGGTVTSDGSVFYLTNYLAGASCYFRVRVE
jgi:hypothetical protein